jgi:hypothetical protein
MADKLTPAQHTLRARLAAHVSWANATDRAARTDRQVDPHGTLPPEERARRAANARSAYFTALALRSSQARRRPRTDPDTDESG